ncbi:polysaccharide deacetylase family protein [Sporosarcina ureilytica]|uniref:Polysaccharide deacetylase n=1 Tax=Sporosarcina ureilytica TaxID=298596 RepID=A0A1D8JI52_9BACL|nr:polysaccharide deacetylase family protein [Sporosarcina ureilytica]AOV08395.1 polysaccharide deacetylase [Sporosarcina ureilytica]
MSKRFIYILTMLILLLAACTQENKEVLEGESEDATVAEEQVSEDEEDKNLEEVSYVEDDEIKPLYLLDKSWGFQPIDDANSKVVLLTIDDAPDKYALYMAKTLKELDVPAIFFVNGHFLNTDEEKAVLKEIYEMGFTIGNHTKTHANLQQLSEVEQKDEIVSVSDVVEQVIGERPKFFRAPFGQNTDYSKEIVADDGMLLMNWTYGYDWEKQYMEAEALADIMVNTEFMRDGANLLMHDREWTAAALKDIVEGLRAKGYDFIDPETIQGVE